MMRLYTKSTSGIFYDSAFFPRKYHTESKLASRARDSIHTALHRIMYALTIVVRKSVLLVSYTFKHYVPR